MKNAKTVTPEIREIPPNADPEPCPFCGSKSLRVVYSPFGMNVVCYAADSSGCQAMGPLAKTSAEAWTKWTTRPLIPRP